MLHDFNKNKQQKSEDFIGETFNNGKLKVIGIHGKQGTTTLFKVVCNICCQDKELFPEGYFVSTKGNLKKGQKPCGCSKKYKWTSYQYLILARRAGEKRGFIVHGFAEDFHRQMTKLNLECLKDGHTWTATVKNIIHADRGCPKCKSINSAEQKKIPNHTALQRCIDICKEMNYDAIGFVGEYRGVLKTRFEYVCPKHGKQNVRYHDFVTIGSRCSYCWKDKQKELGNGNGYFPERKDETDFLYVLNFNNQFIKVGRSFDVERRIPELQRESGIQEVIKLRLFNATHQQIYDFEQELHNELRERNFQHYVDWSTECFENDCLYVLNKLLDSCGLEECITK